MIKLLRQSGEYVLDRIWIPENLFDMERSLRVERSEDEVETFLYGDTVTFPNVIHFRSRRIHRHVRDSLQYIETLKSELFQVETLDYYDILIPLKDAYFTWEFEDNMRIINVSLFLVPEDVL